MHFANLAEQVNPGLSNKPTPVLTQPDDPLARPISLYNSIINAQEETPRPLLGAKDFVLAECIHVPDEDLFLAMTEYYYDHYYSEGVYTARSFPYTLYKPGTLEVYCPEKEQERKALLSGLYTLKEADTLILDGEMGVFTSESPEITIRRLLKEAAWTFDLTSRRLLDPMQPNLALDHPALLSSFAEEDTPATYLAGMYIINRFVKALNTLTTALYENNDRILSHFHRDPYSCLASLIACVDPGAPKGETPSPKELLLQIVFARVAFIRALIIRDYLPSVLDHGRWFNAKSSAFVNTIDMDLEGHPLIFYTHDTRLSMFNLAIGGITTSFIADKKNPACVSMLPIAGEKTQHWLQLRSNIARQMQEDREVARSTHFELPHLPMDQPMLHSNVSFFVLPSIIGVNPETIKTTITRKIQDRTTQLPKACLSLQIKDSHEVDIPFFLGVNSYATPCLLIPYNRNTMQYIRKLYGIPDVDPLRGYGPITRGLIDPGATEFSAFLGNGKLTLFVMDGGIITIDTQLKQPSLVDIRRYFGQEAEAEPSETDIFWEIKMSQEYDTENPKGFINFILGLIQNTDNNE